MRRTWRRLSVGTLLTATTIGWSQSRSPVIDAWLKPAVERLSQVEVIDEPTAVTIVPVQALMPMPTLPTPTLPTPIDLPPKIEAPATLPTSIPTAMAAPPTLDEVEECAQVMPIDLPTTLQLANAQNPLIHFARERIAEARARILASNVLWLPTVRAGVSYNYHTGTLQETLGTVREVRRADLFSGLGAVAIGAGSPINPGVSSQFHLADALFQPLVERQTAAAIRCNSAAQANDLLLAAALAYLDLLEATQDRLIAQESVDLAGRLVKITQDFAKAGKGLPADADRAVTEQQLRINDQHRSDENRAVASARLAQLLHLDATIQLSPIDPTVAPLDLVANAGAVRELVQTGLQCRPELAEASHLTSAACARLQRERWAPLVPSLLVNVSAGGFGGGPSADIRNFNDRVDVDVAAFWSLRNLGLGDLAEQRRQASSVRQAQHRHLAVMDQVAREVTEAAARVQHRQRLLSQTEAGTAAAKSSLDRNFQRITGGQGLPLEALQSIQAYTAMQREQLRSLVDFNRAQMQLLRALGWSIPDHVNPTGQEIKTPVPAKQEQAF